jgi:hypothetical protein
MFPADHLKYLRQVEVRSQIVSEQFMSGLHTECIRLQPWQTAFPPLLGERAGVREGQSPTSTSAKEQSHARPHPNPLPRGEGTCRRQPRCKRTHQYLRSREASWSAVAYRRFRSPDTREKIPQLLVTSAPKRQLRSAPPPHPKTLARSFRVLSIRIHSCASRTPTSAFRVPPSHFADAPC